MRRGLAALVLVLTLGACGADQGDVSLTQSLAAVDAAAVADDPAALEAAVTDLLDALDAAERAGDVDADRARRVRAAARTLLAASRPADEPTDQPTEGQPSAPPPAEESEDDEEREDRGNRGGREDRGKRGEGGEGGEREEREDD